MSLFHEKLFWKLNQYGVLALWIFLIYGSLESLDPLYNTLLAVLLLFHILQFLFISRKLNHYIEFTVSQIAVLILLLGYSWWVPLLLEQKKKNQSF
jgi:hypothetical protein